ncbi:MAG: DeoR/GlpR family DNA-binding transcription regulator [Azoarcus sp.]|jgi:DeoR/GlpR family transcriptional regulator of sugar metabolism|nr:DeoR/GlpR family DNA-binding transcription regulator [Azoarcus sp.]
MNIKEPEALLKYRDAHTRRAAIMEQLKQSGFVTIADLTAQLGVSEMTIRRDMRRLDEEGQAISVRGALRLPFTDADIERASPEYQCRISDASQAKEIIGRLAVREIRDDDVIAIDAGTTALQVAMALPENFTGTVVTHSIAVTHYLLSRPPVKTISLGGDIYHKSCALVGSATVDNANRLRTRIFFLGAAAADERGIYVSADVEKLVKQTLMGIANQIILVIDHRKFYITAPVLLCAWEELDTVISDKVPLPGILSFLKEKGIRVVLPE